MELSFSWFIFWLNMISSNRPIHLLKANVDRKVWLWQYLYKRDLKAYLTFDSERVYNQKYWRGEARIFGLYLRKRIMMFMKHEFSSWNLLWEAWANIELLWRSAGDYVQNEWEFHMNLQFSKPYPLRLLC